MYSTISRYLILSGIFIHCIIVSPSCLSQENNSLENEIAKEVNEQILHHKNLSTDQLKLLIDLIKTTLKINEIYFAIEKIHPDLLLQLINVHQFFHAPDLKTAYKEAKSLGKNLKIHKKLLKKLHKSKNSFLELSEKIHTPENEAVFSIIEKCIQHISEQLVREVKNYVPEINRSVEHTKTSLENKREYLSDLINVYTSLVDRSYPFPEDIQNQNIGVIDIAQQLDTLVFESVHKEIKALYPTRALIENFQQVGTYILKIYQTCIEKDIEKKTLAFD